MVYLNYLWQFVSWSVCVLVSLCFGQFVSRSVCVLVSLCPGQFVSWSVCVLSVCVLSVCVLVSLCPGQFVSWSVCVLSVCVLVSLCPVYYTIWLYSALFCYFCHLCSVFLIVEFCWICTTLTDSVARTLMSNRLQSASPSDLCGTCQVTWRSRFKGHWPSVSRYDL